MSNSNKSVREALEDEYGSKCMYHEGIRTLRPPKVGKQVYKGKKLQDQLTLHHLIPANRYKDRGIHGETTEENGAVVCRYCHDYIEQLSEEEREKVNDELREYKRQHSTKCDIVFADKLDLGFEIKAMVFTPEQLTKQKYNRAKDKKEVQEKIREWEEEER